MDPLKNSVKEALDEYAYKNIEVDQNGKNRFISQITQWQKRSKRKTFHFYLSVLAGAGAILLAVLLFMPQLPSNSISEKEINQFVTEYKTIQYTIEDPVHSPTGIEISEKVKEYLTEDAYKKQMANRVYDTAPIIAQQTNQSISLVEVSLVKEKEKDNGMIDYNYTTRIKIYDNQSSKEIEIKGQLTISNEDGLKITRDWENIKRIGDELFK
ncbi:hypothetical protein [Cytobacillus massiliigabonensis]|uniref:hypothetical protein n=1 Tax=Cytobacillus massiliigabonensis TaxID=1871011 RepID=UPI000C819F7D|nr:hypothetical protein [Cytobacillus massiliigabonensis]